MSLSLFAAVRKVIVLPELREILEALSARENFSYHQIVSRPDDTWVGNKGYVQKLFVEQIVSELNPDHDHVMVCGNPGMIEGMAELFVKHGYSEHTRKSAGNLHLEKYWTD